MKINIDFRSAGSINGISNYTRELAKEVLRFNDLQVTGCCPFMRSRDKGFYLWFLGEKHKSIFPVRLTYNNKYRIPIPYEVMMHSFPDINLFFTFHLPNVPFIKPVVSTIHDLLLFKTECEEQFIVDEHKRIIEDTVKRSRYLLTVSQNSKKDLCEMYNLKQEDIYIVHNGIDKSLLSIKGDVTRETVRSNYGLPEHYILYFGGYRKHKNIERLLQAYALCPQCIKDYLKIVITNKNETLIAEAKRLHILDNVHFIGFVSEQDKASVYQMADMVYYASLYEGFGMPIIEAQISNVPVITSNTSSMPEAAGQDAVFVNPYSVDEIKESIERLWDDISFRNNVIVAGHRNALKYNWNKSSEELYNSLNSIYQRL